MHSQKVSLSLSCKRKPHYSAQLWLLKRERMIGTSEILFLLLPGFHLSYFSLHDDTVTERRDLNVAIGNWKAVNLLVLVGAAVTPPVTFASLTKPVKNSEFFCKTSKAKFWVLIFVDLLNIVAECFRSLVRLRINANFLLKHKWQTADW